MNRILAIALLLALASPAAFAQDPAPEIRRAVAPAQATGAAHTLRVIPEACARIDGQFTGQADDPYRVSVSRTSRRCQPRARVVDAKAAEPSAASGWVFNDVVRVPHAACPDQQAVLRVWRRSGAGAPPRADAQGRSRIYLDEARDSAEAGRLARIGEFAIDLSVEGSCR